MLCPGFKCPLKDVALVPVPQCWCICSEKNKPNETELGASRELALGNGKHLCIRDQTSLCWSI